MKNLKEEIVDNDEIFDIFNEIIEDNKIIKDLKKDYPDKIENLEDSPIFMISQCLNHYLMMKLNLVKMLN